MESVEQKLIETENALNLLRLKVEELERRMDFPSSNVQYDPDAEKVEVAPANMDLETPRGGIHDSVPSAEVYPFKIAEDDDGTMKMYLPAGSVVYGGTVVELPPTDAFDLLDVTECGSTVYGHVFGDEEDGYTATFTGNATETDSVYDFKVAEIPPVDDPSGGVQLAFGAAFLGGGGGGLTGTVPLLGALLYNKDETTQQQIGTSSVDFALYARPDTLDLATGVVNQGVVWLKVFDTTPHAEVYN